METPRISESPTRQGISLDKPKDKVTALCQLGEKVDPQLQKMTRKPHFVLNKQPTKTGPTFVLIRKATTGSPLHKPKLLLAPLKIEPQKVIELSPRQQRDQFMLAAKNVFIILI